METETPCSKLQPLWAVLDHSARVEQNISCEHPAGGTFFKSASDCKAPLFYSYDGKGLQASATGEYLTARGYGDLSQVGGGWQSW
eukprot:2102596-Amphidinium_carterae.1